MYQKLFSHYGLKMIASIGLLTSTLSLPANTQSEAIDKLVEKVMVTFKVPGVAIGIIENGKVIHLQGYGIANIDSGDVVDENTIFKIASNSKAFTAAALAILVDQGKLKWHDKVEKYLPEFKMYDPWVSKEFNIIDLLSHRSGLRIGAGDLMLWPEPTKFTRTDVIKNLRYLKPVTSFRDQYAYDNLLYIVAGEVINAISGQPWEDFIKNNIFDPLKMKQCFAGGIDRSRYSNLSAPHRVINKQLMVDSANLINEKTSIMAAAGGIKCSAADLLKWVNVQLQGGLKENGEALFSLVGRDAMWKSVTPLPISSQQKRLDKVHYRGYALGWRVGDFHGKWKISHTGTLSGTMSKIIMLPDENLGVVILINQQSGAARKSLAQGILQEFTGIKKNDWVDYYVNEKAARQSKRQLARGKVDKLFFPEETPVSDTIKNSNLLGRYIDPWFGEISLSRDKHQIMFQSLKSPRLTGTVYFYRQNQWWVKWTDRSFEADAWLYFNHQPSSGVMTLSMQAIDPDADFSFDFEDLDFIQHITSR